jgi:hypothetical protein
MLALATAAVNIQLRPPDPQRIGAAAVRVHCTDRGFRI